MVFMYRPKPFSRVLVPLYLEPIRCFLLGYAATRFLRKRSGNSVLLEITKPWDAIALSQGFQ